MLPEKTDVLVVGAGPVGLATALTLARHGVEVTLVDQAERSPLTSRAAVVHAYTLEELDRIGAAAPLVARGLRAPRFTIRERDRTLFTTRFDNLPTRFPYALMVSQAETETVLEELLASVGGRVLRPYRLVGLDLDAAGAVARFADGATLRARYVVGADGMHSAVRRLAGIGFRDPHGGNGRSGAGGGSDVSDRPDGGGEAAGGAGSFVLADVRIDGGLPRDEVMLFFARQGLLVWAPLPDGVVRLVAPLADPPRHPGARQLQALVDERGPTRPGRITEVLWGSRFRAHHRLADTFRAGPVLLAGDAAHVHSPAGGQGMNLGLRDAVALGSTLASVLTAAGDPPRDPVEPPRDPVEPPRDPVERPRRSAGRQGRDALSVVDPDALLDGYAAQRRPVAEQVLRLTDRLTRLGTAPATGRAVRNSVLRLAAHLPPVRRRAARQISGLAQRDDPS
ncbi:FAD-dependent oxidoreductase [Micromonospora sp. WMMA1923]|uniref:FAD-dependent oxidoreductase n=1 Tax=Micromonospora sp. WMMA1923 TaxID=3404125 RepID=UPI003B961267